MGGFPTFGLVEILAENVGFPHRIGSWTANAATFTGANPKWNGQPWETFDPDTFTLTHTDNSMAGLLHLARSVFQSLLFTQKKPENPMARWFCFELKIC